MTIPTNAFSACTPSLGTTVDRTGTITECNAIPLESDELTATYLSDGNPRIMDALLEWEFEVKTCMAEQKGFKSFLMQNKVMREQNSQRVKTGLFEVMPFVMGRRQARINNAYWTFTGGVETGADGGSGTGYWTITATSPTGIPAATGWFNVGERQYLNGLSAGGTAQSTAYTVVLAVAASATTMTLTLLGQNAGSNMGARAGTDPTSGYLSRGTRNLKSVEPAPGNSHHPNRAIAPGLSCQPGDHLHAIILFLLGVLVEQQTRRFAATSKVDANAGVAVTGQIRTSQRVALVGAVALAIWEILQDRRNRVLFGIVRQPGAGRQRRTVLQRYQGVLDNTHRLWEIRDNHGGLLMMAAVCRLAAASEENTR